MSNGKWALPDFVSMISPLHPHVSHVHIREKRRSAREIYDGVKGLKQGGVPGEKIIVNDRVDVAESLGVRGVQLAYHSLDVAEVRKHFPRLRIGKSVHSREEAKQAEEAGADYIVFGHVFSSTSKPDLPPKGLKALQDLVDDIALPVIAIGGITPDKVSSVRETGAAGIAVMSGVLEAENPRKALLEYKKGWEI